MKASSRRASASTRGNWAARAAGSGATSSSASAFLNASVASVKQGVPGPLPGRVAQRAPAGMNDSWPWDSKLTQPASTVTSPPPIGSTSSV